jgi:hypothetical protein
MHITIENTGLQTLLNMLLSCKCPVSEETERVLFQEYHKVKHQELIDFSALLKVADMNPQRTPLHLVADFCSWSKDSLREFTITHNDILRYSCTGQHFYHFLNAVNPLIVKDTASFMLGHMLVPAALHKDGETLSATYQTGERTIRFFNVLLPPEIPWQGDGVYGVHLGTALTLLDREQEKMVREHLANIEGFAMLADDVSVIDYGDFQRYGDYRAQVQRRITRNFPG